MIRKHFTKGMITSPYAHAGLASGEAGSSRFGDENIDVPLVFIAFREHVQKTQKRVRGPRLVAMDGSRWTNDCMRQQNAYWLERFESTFAHILATRHPEKKIGKDT